MSDVITTAWCPNCDDGYYVDGLVGEKCKNCTNRYRAVEFERKDK